MAKSQGDKIDELSSLVATLTERVDHVREQVEELGDLLVRVALLEHQVQEIRSGSKQWGNLIWTAVLSLLSAVIGAGVLYYLGWKK